MLTLIIICIIDYVTGVIKSLVNGVESSKIGYRGIMKKCSVLLVVMLTIYIDTMFKSNISNFTIITFCANELLSICENFSEMGVDVKCVINDIIEKLKGGE